MFVALLLMGYMITYCSFVSEFYKCLLTIIIVFGSFIVSIELLTPCSCHKGKMHLIVIIIRYMYKYILYILLSKQIFE